MALQQFVINLVLMVVWAFLQDAFDYVTLATGYLLGAAMIYVVDRMIGVPFYLRRLGKVIELVLVFLWEVVVANVRVAYQVLHPALPVQPGFIALPLDVKSEWQISLLAILITMTPGTMSVDVSDDRRFLIVHTLDASDPEGVKASIKESFERRILEVTA